jgi:hypothetical protein
MVPDYSGLLPRASEATLKEWACLDAFDMLSPVYDKPQTLRSFKQWHVESGLADVLVERGYNGLEGRGTKRQSGCGMSGVALMRTLRPEAPTQGRSVDL